MLKRTIFTVSNFALSLLCIAAATLLQSSASTEQVGSTPAAAYQAPLAQEVWSSMQAEIPANAKSNSMEEFLNLTPRKVKAMTGEKMSVKEVVALKIAQKKLKKALAPGAKAPADLGWASIVSMATGVSALVTFLVGFLCPLLWLLSILLGIAGVVFGIIGLGSSKRGLAVAGLITGGITILAFLGVVLAVGFA